MNNFLKDLKSFVRYKKKVVCIFYRRSHMRLGSYQLRCKQLQDYVNQNSQRIHVFKFHVSTIYNPIFVKLIVRLLSNFSSTMVVHKDAYHVFDDHLLEYCKKYFQYVCIDPIDANISQVNMKSYDAVICSSQKQYSFISTKLKMPAIINIHLPNIIFNDVNSDNLIKNKVIYFGEKHNFYLPDPLKKLVEIYDYKGELGPREYKLLTTAMFHYAVRPDYQNVSNDVITPPTKILTAAYCERPIIISKRSTDALDLLGAEYPFFIENLISNEACDEILNDKNHYRVAIKKMLEIKRTHTFQRQMENYEHLALQSRASL